MMFLSFIFHRNDKQSNWYDDMWQQLIDLN
jgi:hypothetical protein